MSDELIDRYVDRAAVTDDTNFFAEKIKIILDLFDKLNGTKVSISGANSMSDIVNGAKEAKTALDQLATAKDQLTKSELLLAKLAKENAVALSAQAKAAQAAAKSSQEKAKADALEAKAIKDLAAAEKLEAGAKKELALQEKALAQARKENAIAANVEQKTANAAARDKEKQQLNELGYAYREYSKAARDASLRAKSYALTLGEGDPRTLAAIKNAKEMNETLARVDASVGHFGRNVGNYKSGFDGLANSFTQVARELPSLAVSVQTFALAISNNLPMVVDEVKKTSDQVKELRAQGEQTPGVFKRILTSALSLNVGLSIGIALITAYAGQLTKWISALFSSSAAMMQAAEAQDVLNAARKEAILNEKSYQSLLNNDAQDRFTKKLKDDLDLARARGASEKEILQIERSQAQLRLDRARNNYIPDTNFLGRMMGGSEEQLRILQTSLDKAKAAYQDFLKTGSAFGKTFEKGTEDYQKTDNLLKNSFEFQSLLYSEQADKINEFYDAQRALRVKDEEIKRLQAEDYLKFFADELQKQADLLKKFSEVEELPAFNRVKMRERAAKLELIILQGLYNDDIKAAKNNDTKIAEINRKFQFDKKTLAENTEADILMIRGKAIEYNRELDSKYNEDYKEYQEQRTEAQIKAIQDEQARRQAARANGQQIEIDALNKSYNAAIGATKAGSVARERVERAYAEKRSDIEFKYAEAELRNQIEAAEKYIKIHKDRNEDVSDKETELSKLKIQLSDLTTQHIIDNSKREGKSRLEALEDAERGLNTLKGVYTETTNLIDGLLGASIDKQKNAIEDQIKGIEDRLKVEIDAINASSKTQEEKAQEVQIAQAKAAAEKAQLERRQAELDQRRAKFDKAVTIGKIITETALAVVHQLHTGDPITQIPRAIAVGAIGAAQLAVAVATPIPKFKDGRDFGPETYAIVGDGGKSEVITSPDLSQVYVTPATDTLTHLKKDWKVFPDVKEFIKSAGMMGTPQLAVMPMQENDNAAMQAIGQIISEMNSLKQVVKDKQETHLYWKNGELKKSVKIANDWYHYIQNNFR